MITITQAPAKDQQTENESFRQALKGNHGVDVIGKFRVFWCGQGANITGHDLTDTDKFPSLPFEWVFIGWDGQKPVMFEIPANSSPIIGVDLLFGNGMGH